MSEEELAEMERESEAIRKAFWDMQARATAAEAENAKLREALDTAAFRTQMLVDRMQPDEDGKTSKALAQTYVDAMRAALETDNG